MDRNASSHINSCRILQFHLIIQLGNQGLGHRFPRNHVGLLAFIHIVFGQITKHLQHLLQRKDLGLTPCFSTFQLRDLGQVPLPF